MLQEQDYENAAKIIGCEAKVIKAVAKVEAPKGAFDEQGRPTILYEPFQFGRLTEHKYDGIIVNLDGNDYPLSLKGKWSIERAKYGKFSIQYRKLDAAEKLDLLAARKSCSWGMFQLMGFNFKECGYDTFMLFYADMHESEVKQLKAYLNFLKSKDLGKYLVSEDFISFAEGYNGSGQVERYAGMIKDACNE
jgi:hypothetical protein